MSEIKLDFYSKWEQYRPFFIKVAKYGMAGLGLFLFTAYKLQSKIIYHPEVPGLPLLSKHNSFGFRSPFDMQLSFESVEIATEDKIKIRGWFLKQNQSENAPTVVFFHENAGNLGSRLQYLRYYYQLVKSNILIVAYRGYDESDKVQISQKGIEMDVKAVLKHVFERNDIDLNNVFTHGRSLGGATSIVAVLNQQQQSQQKVRGMILENTFTSIYDVGLQLLPKFLIRIAGVVLVNRWESLKVVDQIQCPGLFIQSMRDELVPPSHMDKLYEKFQGEKSKFVIQDGDHNGNWMLDHQLYFKNISDFINKHKI